MTADTPIFVSWTIDCEATQKAIANPELGARAIQGFVEAIHSAGLRATLFVLPGDAAAYPKLLRELAGAGFEVGLHLHPQEAGYADFCGAYTGEQQRQMYSQAMREFSDAVGFSPQTFRTGSFSANDATFPVCDQLGFTSTSHSCPGRNMANLRSNWTGAPHHVHFAHPANRLLEGGLSLVEVPVTTDPDSMLWSGVHPQDLRVELFDAKNQKYMIDKVLGREKARQAAVRSVVVLTHNLFNFDRPDDFYGQTLRQMIADFNELADKHAVTLCPATIGETASAFRAAVAAERGRG